MIARRAPGFHRRNGPPCRGIATRFCRTAHAERSARHRQRDLCPRRKGQGRRRLRISGRQQGHASEKPVEVTGGAVDQGRRPHPKRRCRAGGVRSRHQLAGAGPQILHGNVRKVGCRQSDHRGGHHRRQCAAPQRGGRRHPLRFRARCRAMEDRRYPRRRGWQTVVAARHAERLTEELTSPSSGDFLVSRSDRRMAQIPVHNTCVGSPVCFARFTA
jgi:hypothetical protein